MATWLHSQRGPPYVSAAKQGTGDRAACRSFQSRLAFLCQSVTSRGGHIGCLLGLFGLESASGEGRPAHGDLVVDVGASITCVVHHGGPQIHETMTDSYQTNALDRSVG